MVKNLLKCIAIHISVFLVSNEMTLPSFGDGIERMNLLTEMVKILTILTGMNYKQPAMGSDLCEGFPFL